MEDERRDLPMAGEADETGDLPVTGEVDATPDTPTMSAVDATRESPVADAVEAPRELPIMGSAAATPAEPSAPTRPEARDLPPTGEADATLPPPVATSATAVQVLSGAAGRAMKGQELLPGQQPRRQMKVGRVVSDKMDKTVIIAVEYTRPHPIYKKAMKRTSKFVAHDENNECKAGDVVRIEETRPLSKTKRWIVREVIQRRVVA